MYIYIIGLLITILLIWLAENKVQSKKAKNILIILSILPLFLISALRYNVGTDYIKRYTNDYLNMAQGKDISNLEIGFKAINFICLIFTKEPYLLFTITSFIILALFFTTIFKESENKILSIIIFFLGGYFFGSLNLVRQYIAIGFLFVGYRFLLSNDKKKMYIGFITCAILAFLMHSTSIVGFVLMFLNKKMLANIKWVLSISIILLILNENIMKVLEIIIEKTRFNVYLSGNMARGEVSILNILENLIVYIWMYSIYWVKNKNNEEISKKAILLLNIQGLSTLITVAGVCHMQFSRIALYFYVFQILSIPYYISIIPFKRIAEKITTKINKNVDEKKVKIIANIVVVLAFMGMFTYTNILNNDNEVLPYKTVFEIKNI